MNEVFSLRSIAEKCLNKSKKVYCVIMDLEKACDESGEELMKCKRCLSKG